MKRTLIALFVLILPVCAFAYIFPCAYFLAHPDDRVACEECGIAQEAPEYYCDCRFGVPLYYGLDTIITDDTWFKATLAQVRSTGIYGCWFGDKSLVMDFFLQCTQTSAFVTREISKNNVMSIEPEQLEEYLSRPGIGLLDDVDLYVRASFKREEGDSASYSGRLIGLPTSQGLNSNCDNEIFPVTFNYKVILNDNEENVYEWKGERMTSYYRNNPLSIAFKRRIDNPSIQAEMDMYITTESCNGPIVATKHFTDTAHAYFIDPQLLTEHYNSGKSLFFHFIPRPGAVNAANVSRGKVIFRPATTIENGFVKDTSICEGAELIFEDRILKNSTVFYDTVNAGADNLYQVNQYNLTVISVEPVDTTLYWRDADLNNTDFLGWKRFSNYGLYQDVRNMRATGECIETYNVNIVHLMDSVFHEPVDSTVCKGSIINLYGKKYTSNTTVTEYSLSKTIADRLDVYTYNLHFTEPELEYDTIRISINMLPYTYKGVTFTDFGVQEAYVHGNGRCDHRYQIACLRATGDVQTIIINVDTTLCTGQTLQIGEENITTSGTYTNIEQLDSLTILTTTYNVTFTPTPRDTVTLETKSLPIEYEGVTIKQYGLQILPITDPDGCAHIVYLTVTQLPDTTYFEKQLEACVGKAIEVEGKRYYTDTVFTVNQQLDRYTYWQTTYTLHFTALEPISETIVLSPNAFPTKYKGQLIDHFGEYDITTLTDEGCEQLIHLTVNSTTSDNLAEINKFNIYPTAVDKNGAVFVVTNNHGELAVFDMLGRQIQNIHVQKGENKLTLSQSGNYILRVVTDNAVFTARVMVK